MRLRHDIGGRPAGGTGHREVLDAPDARPLYEVPEATDAEIDRAAGLAAGAFRSWRRSTQAERAAVLRGAAARLRERRGELGALLVRETGRVAGQAVREVDGAARILDQYAQVDLAESGRVINRSSPRVWGVEVAEPLGVAALVSAWNVPLQLAAHKVGAALTAGCTAVLKPSPLAAAAVQGLADALYAAGLPHGVLSVLHGGADTARALLAHPEVRVVSFTGGDAAGREIMAAASDGLKKVVLELGGKSANAVFADAPMDRVVDGLVAGFTRNQGAVCTAATRILIQRQAYDEVVERLSRAVKNLQVGDPYTAGPEIGALRHAELAATMDTVLAGSRLQAGVTVTGGERVEVAGRTGSYRAPALITAGRTADVPLARRELFTPVAVVVPFDDEDELVAAVEDSDHGLAAGLWTGDVERAERIWDQLTVGTVYLNSYHRIDAIPLASGGRRASGFGSEGGRRGVEEFMAPKAIHFPRTGW
ncbi:aldehyde dehydrogenase family protein [Kitasatospora sp. NPDC047058]|uniref:aldehyde dehydrogenase family protein n=1 Tax=Kitasatospora sp. NPDC047058 TaxID=3155620 RepID=UPI0033E87612